MEYTPKNLYVTNRIKLTSLDGRIIIEDIY